jgi:hypothetical protein
VKSVNNKLSTSTYLKLGETNGFINFSTIHSFTPSPSLPLPPTFLLPPKFLIPSPARRRGRGCASAPTRGCRRASARTRVRAYITPVRVLLFCSFPSFAFGWNCGICLAMPISTFKGRRGHKHFEGDPLAFFAKQKFKGCIYPLDACVFNYAGVYVKIFRCCRRRNRRPFLEICRCHDFFGGWCGLFEFH